MSAAEEFEALLPQAVRDSDLYRQALTHSSASTENNERLEFLGDAVLDCIISHELHDRFPNVDEGGLTQMRAHLVSRRALAECAKNHGVDTLVRMDLAVPQAQGGAAGNALEAVIAAVYLVAGLDAAREFVCALYATQLATLTGVEQVRNPKAVLQELLQGRGLSRPHYERVSESEQNGPRFTVRCEVAELELSAEGSDTRMRDAEAAAAEQVLRELRRLHPKW